MAAGGEELLGLGSDARRIAAAILFMGAGTNAYDAFSAVNSSPWTAESFGGDAAKERSLREYVIHALVISGLYAVGGAIIARNLWPILGALIASVYMTWLYFRAIGRARARGSTGWSQ
jgi:hypothetical protein